MSQTCKASGRSFKITNVLRAVLSAGDGMKHKILVAVISFFCLILFYLCYRATFPQSLDIVGVRLNKTPQNVELPFTFEEEFATVELTILHTNRTASTFRIFSDDCLSEVQVNGLRYSEPFPECNYPHGQLLDFSRYLRHGPNRLRFLIKNTGGPGFFDISPVGTFSEQAPALIVVVLGLLFTVWLMQTNRHSALGLAFAIGVILRCLYFTATPYWVRSHDAMDHIQYIRHVAETGELPSPTMGIESHQAPLYYVSVARLLNVDQLRGATNYIAFRDIQFVGLLCNIGALAALLCAAAIALRHRTYRTQLLFGLLLGAIPGTIFPLARISNDVAYQLFGALFFSLLVYWWDRKSSLILYAAVSTGIVAVLAKLSALSLLPLPFLLVGLAKEMEIRQKLILLSKLAFVVAAGVGSYLYLRIKQQGAFSLSGAKELNSALLVPVTWKEYLTFSPADIIAHPFVATVSDETRRQYIWEVLFRTTFFGEFNFAVVPPAIITTILTLGLAGIFFAVLGFAKKITYDTGETLPVALLLVLLLGSLISFHQSYPYAFTQDFRFVPLLAFPILYFAAHGTEGGHVLLNHVKVAAALIAFFSQVYFLAYLITGAA